MSDNPITCAEAREVLLKYTNGKNVNMTFLFGGLLLTLNSNGGCLNEVNFTNMATCEPSGRLRVSKDDVKQACQLTADLSFVDCLTIKDCLIELDLMEPLLKRPLKSLTLRNETMMKWNFKELKKYLTNTLIEFTYEAVYLWFNMTDDLVEWFKTQPFLRKIDIRKMKLLQVDEQLEKFADYLKNNGAIMEFKTAHKYDLIESYLKRNQDMYSNARKVCAFLIHAHKHMGLVRDVTFLIARFIYATRFEIETWAN